MKIKTLHQRLETQYYKLKTRLQKAVTSGRFALFSAFKQRQWLKRIQRCRVQLMRASAGVAISAMLGTTVDAQIPQYYFTEQIGTQNPLNVISVPPRIQYFTFADLDGDTDLDVVVDPYSQGGLLYYENIGSATQATFRQIVNPNPLHVSSTFSADIRGVTFVDIDGDGDLDMFASNVRTGVAGTNTTEIYYAENTGVANNPTFSDSTNAASHPLSNARSYIAGLNLPGDRSPMLSFTDIDNDGDQDCFIAIEANSYGFSASSSDKKVLYYRNIGTATSPQFQLQSLVDNPLKPYIDSVGARPLNDIPERPMIFADFDNDGDQDVVIMQYDYLPPPAIARRVYYMQNIGTPNSPAFQIESGVFPQQVVNTVRSAKAICGWADLSGDGQIDVFTNAFSGGVQSLRYFKMDSVRVVSVVPIPDAQSTLKIYPNPTTGVIRWDRPLTGTVRVMNHLGQEVYSKELVEAQTLRLNEIPRGLYVLQLTTKEEEWAQLIEVQ